METTNFGTFLKTEREKRQLTLAELSQATKLSVSSLKVMETGNLDDLPPDVFVRGFIRCYAKTIGISSNEPLGLLDQVLSERRRAAEPPVMPAMVVSRPLPAPPTRVPAALPVEDESQSPRHGIGLAVFVIIVLLIATITLSLFLRQQPQSGEGLSLKQDTPSTLLASSRHT
jgi:cytoskeletal protein RodZ